MSDQSCRCDIVLNNTGVPNCQYIMGIARKIIVVPITADDGTDNNIDLVSDTLNQAYFDGKVNETDASKRWYPLPLIKNVEDVRGDAVLETLNDGENIFIQKGTRTFTGVMVKNSAVLLDKLQEIRCKEVGIYVVDNEESLIGELSSDGVYLNPIRLNKDTWYPRLVKATDTTSQKIQVDFEFSQLALDERLRVITASEHVASLLTLNGLLDVNAVITSPTPTGFVAAMTLDFGTAKNPIDVKGWVLADFYLYNNTDSAVITITSVTESPDGTYTFVIPDNTGDNVTLSQSAAKTGFELSATFDLP